VADAFSKAQSSDAVGACEINSELWLAVALEGVRGQPLKPGIRPAKNKKKWMTAKQKENQMRLPKQIVLIVAALAATTSLVCGQGQQSAESAGTQSIVGTWQVLRHGVDCVTGNRLNPDFPTLITFNRGGTLNAFGLAPGDTPGLVTPECGNWSQVPGTHTYTARDVSYSYDESGNFTGRGEITITATLATNDTFTADTVIDVFDADGNLLFSFCGMWTGTRFQ